MNNDGSPKCSTQQTNRALIEADIRTFMTLLSLLAKSSSVPEEWKEKILGADYTMNKLIEKHR
jgi:hypothetical protein